MCKCVSVFSYLLLGLVLLRLILPGPLLLCGGLRIGRVGGIAVRLESVDRRSTGGLCTEGQGVQPVFGAG